MEKGEWRPVRLPGAALANKMGHGVDLAAGAGFRLFTGVSIPVEIVAHRGANREAPENTLPAFARALELGVQGIELDVQLTRDGVPVVHHDPDLHRASVNEHAAPIASLSLSDIRHQSDAPALDDVLDLVSGRCRLYIEIKAAAAVDSVVERIHDKTSWCAVHSFDHRSVARAAALDPELTTGILLVSYLVDVVSAMRAARARDLWQQADFIDRDLVERVHEAKGRVVAWTVNDISRARSLMDLGVDVICTDLPGELLAALR